MRAVRKIIEQAPERIFIDVPEELRNQKLEVIILPAADQPTTAAPVNTGSEKKDLSIFFGKLKWQGDAVAEQRKLRDEWD